jgi:hypothetical protein
MMVRKETVGAKTRAGAAPNETAKVQKARRVEMVKGMMQPIT